MYTVKPTQVHTSQIRSPLHTEDIEVMEGQQQQMEEEVRA